MTREEALPIVNSEMAAWEAYKAYCTRWRLHRNFPSQDVFKGDAESAALWTFWQGRRLARQAVSRGRHLDSGARFQPRHRAA